MKKLTATTLALTCLLGVSAAPITPDQALSRISGNTRAVRAPGLSTHNLSLKYTARQENGASSAYIFTPEEGEGFIILSADDVAVPVYGYADSGTFDVNNIPPALKWWLGQLSSRITYAQDINIEQPALKAYAPEDMTPVSPLVKTKWNQDAPYNNQTPEINGRHTYTGCVATSFAQAMKYFNYPQKGQGSISYSDGGTRRSMTLDRPFLWDMMLDSYTGNDYTSQEVFAVAYLMKACGFSVEMSYGLQASGALSYKLANAAVQYFLYDPGVYYTEREYYTLDEWTRMIYNNIKNIGPVIYDGIEMDGGHSFICDGYDGNGYFHFNWGWGGMSDGYFVLDALNPESQGIGASEGGFNRSQGALIGLQPPVQGSHLPYGQMKIGGTVTAKLSGKNLTFNATNGNSFTGWGNAAYRNVTFSLGAIISNIDGTGQDIDVAGTFQRTDGTFMQTVTLGALNYIPDTQGGPMIQLPTLADGDYKVTVAAKDTDQAGAPMLPMLCENGDVNYCHLKVANGVYTVTSVSPMKIKYDKVEFSSPLYLNRNCRISVEASNSSDIQLSQSYYPALYRNGNIQYVGDYMLLTVNPGVTATSETFTRFSAVANATSTGLGTYQLALVDAASNQLLGLFGEYEMTNVSGSLKLTLNDFSIEGSTQEDVTVGSRTFNDVYIINDANEIDINFDYTVDNGYFDSLLRIVGAWYDPATNKFVNMEDDVYAEHPFTGQGSDNELTIPFDLNGLNVGVYRLSAGYAEAGGTKSIGLIYFQLKNSGVENVIDDLNTEAVYYNLQGVRVNNPQPGQLLIEKKGNTSRKVIF